MTNLAFALEHLRAGRFAEAAIAYQAILERDPANIEALHFLGIVAFQQGRHAEAERCIRAALALNPANAPAHNNLANAVAAQGRLSEAIAGYRRALELSPNYADAQANLVGHLSVFASTLTDAGRPAEAVRQCEEALALRPDMAETHNCLGHARQALGEIAAAEQCYRRAIELKPDLAGAKVNLGILRLVQGDYAAGFALLESRFAAFGGMLFDPVLRWNGEPAKGKRLLLWSEQGLGDSIMMIRYLPMVKRAGFASVVLYTYPGLVRLLDGVSNSDPAPEFDLHCPIMSLPLIFGTRTDSIPPPALLVVPAEMKDRWISKLSALPPRRVGLCWAGSKGNRKNAVRSVRLAQLAPLFAVPGLSFVNLQKGDGAQELIASPWKIADWMDDCTDLLDTAALISGLDLVVTVDTAIAHLAGTLGKPVWMLDRFESEWRWMVGSEKATWYPSKRLFSQTNLGDWETPIARIAAALLAITRS